MKLSSSWLLSAFVVATSASLEASVYLIQASNLPESSSPPTLSPEQTRLVFAQRLGISRWHSLGDASAKTLSYINKFGGQHESLFGDAIINSPAELVLIVEGASSQAAGPLLEAWSQKKPTFFVSNPPSVHANYKLVGDLANQMAGNPECSLEDGINPFSGCWEGKSKVHHYDLSKPSNTIEKLLAVQKRMLSYVESEALNVLVVLMPKSSADSKSDKNPYGVYEMPTQTRISARFVEEPMNGDPLVANAEPSTSSNPTMKPIVGVPKVCHATLESCTEKTNGCSGHGSCHKKRAGSNSCFACVCKAQKEAFVHGPENETAYRLVDYGGAACQKQDVSGPFWLIFIFTIVMVGLVSWSIGLMYSVGEEQLPGVIGAGVSNNKAR